MSGKNTIRFQASGQSRQFKMRVGPGVKIHEEPVQESHSLPPVEQVVRKQMAKKSPTAIAHEVLYDKLAQNETARQLSLKRQRSAARRRRARPVHGDVAARVQRARRQLACVRR